MAGPTVEMADQRLQLHPQPHSSNDGNKILHQEKLRGDKPKNKKAEAHCVLL